MNKIAMLSSIARRTPSRSQSPRENLVFLLTEALVRHGFDVTLFATGNSTTRGKLASVCPKGYEEDNTIEPAVWECLHVSEVFEQSNSFDLIHNHLDYLPLTYTGMTTTPMVTTTPGVISSQILPVYQKYNDKTFYVAASEADKNPELDYIATIYPAIDLTQPAFQPEHGNYLLFFGNIRPGQKIGKCIEIAQQTGLKLVIAGAIYDRAYFNQQIKPFLDNNYIIHQESPEPAERNKLFGNACALLHPVKTDETLGLSAIEAMACGTPVIALNQGRMPEIIADGITGFLVNNRDEMSQAVLKIKQLDRQQCRQWVETHFGADRMVENYIKVYESIIRQTMREDHRPWGFYEILLDDPEHKVKRITVYPGQRLSYQRHFRRSEHWYIIGGTALITRNGKDIELTFGKSIDLPVGTWHRVRNPGSENMVFIEVQTGDYFGEDDIERSEDDYGRS